MSDNGRKNEKMMGINTMVLTVVFFYLVTELLCLMACLRRVGLFFTEYDFFQCVSANRILVLLMILNPCINTLCYLLMSSQYRRVLIHGLNSLVAAIRLTSNSMSACLLPTWLTRQTQRTTVSGGDRAPRAASCILYRRTKQRYFCNGL